MYRSFTILQFMIQQQKRVDKPDNLSVTKLKNGNRAKKKV